MKITGSTALVTGAGRGIGREIALELLDRGATVYAGVRDPSHVQDSRLIPVALDVTDAAQVAAAAARIGDATIVVNNAGIAAPGSLLGEGALEDAQRELDVNYLGTLRVARAFAPVLAANGGGALVNVLSVVSFVASPQLASYSASKSAAWSATNTLRVELRAQGTLVVGVHMGFVDTDLTAGITDPKIAPSVVAQAVAEAIEQGTEELLVDDLSRQVKSALADDQGLLYPGIQERYDAALAHA
jgi:NAD(P)-dependent dehydrogenase (short-subunit alcohol dehydrogenase family)